MDTLLKIRKPIEQDLSDFRQLFETSLTSNNPLLQHVSSHILGKRGKMMRPILVLLCARLHSAVRPASLFTAVSLELLHTASLIHDDVVDESKERRGQKSLNAIYDNRISVLTGDYLLATSLHYASKTSNNKIIEVVSQLGRDLSDGELLQLDNSSRLAFLESDYYNVIKKKTAALFSACAITGTLSVTSNMEKVKFAHRLGEIMGICFQIRDDIFDYYNDDSIGKPTHQDMIEGKLTLPALYAVNNSKESWVKEVAISIKNGHASITDIERLAEYVVTFGGIDYAVEQMNKLHDEGCTMLSTIPDSEIKTSLSCYLDYVVDRSI